MSDIQITIAPHTQQPCCTRTYPSAQEVDATIERAAQAYESWKLVPLKDRIVICEKFLEEIEKKKDIIAKELTMQMGRPISQTPGELKGFATRGKHLLSIAEDALKDIPLKESDTPGFRRYIRRVPLGVSFLIVPWNYPYLTSINSLLPSLLAGNTVILKPSPQTPLTAETLNEAFKVAGLPADVIQVLHLTPELVKHVIRHPKVGYISFTGSVSGGRDVDQTAASTGDFKTVGLELGGKDPAYVRADAPLDYTVSELVDGALFNSGQSCCSVERIYVHESLYEEFVKKYVDLVKTYKLGDPMEEGINLGPVISVTSAERIKKQVADAVSAGAKALVPDDLFPIANAPGSAYVAPQVLVDVDHTMDVVMEETFGPVVPILKVSGDEEAIKLMNDSEYGLTASIWTTDEQAFEALVDRVEAGVKHSGRGISLSKYGFDQVTRAKSVHIKTVSST